MRCTSDFFASLLKISSASSEQVVEPDIACEIDEHAVVDDSSIAMVTIVIADLFMFSFRSSCLCFIAKFQVGGRFHDKFRYLVSESYSGKSPL